MMKKKVGIFIVTLLILIAVFSITSSSSEKTMILKDRPCPCLHEIMTSDDPLETIDIYEQTLKDIPLSWDWRNVNGSDWTTPIKNQYQDICGSCWAFGALGGLEATLKIWENNPMLDVDLSEQYMLSCSPGSCNGWYLDRTVKWIKTNGSIPESCFQYLADDTIPCDTKCANWRDMLVGVDGYKKITANITVIQSALIEYGPLPASMDVYTDFYPNYTGGVYIHTNGTYVFGHVVTIIGYKITRENEGYWICKNSWGTSWGEQGWFRIAFGECKIEKGVYCYTGPNYVVVNPEKPSGSIKGIPGQTYRYTAVAVDPDNDKMKYCFDWGVGKVNWTDLNASGIPVSLNHAWSEKGTYNVRVKVKDEHELESDWSDSLTVTITKSKNKMVIRPFLQILQNFFWNNQYLFSIL